MNELLALAVLGAAAYAASRNTGGLSTQSDQLAASQQPSAPNPDFAATIRATTGLPASVDNVTPGVLSSGEIRTMPPATPDDVRSLTTNPVLAPVIIDGNWINATPGTAQAIQVQNQIARGQTYWRPSILPPPTAPMRQAISEGNNLENDILPAAAALKFQRGGPSAFDGYLLPVGAWNWYRLQYDGGMDIATTRLDDQMSANDYGALVASRPGIKSWTALNGVGVTRTTRANMWAT